MKLKTLKFIIWIFSVIYPFALFFYGGLSVFILGSLGILWGVRGVFESGNFRLFCFLISFFFLLCVIFKESGLAFLYPVLMSLLFLFVFLFSLKGESVITKIARLKESNLSEEAVIYTRNLTKIWCGFFAMNAMIAYALSLMDDKIYWSFYSGAISYILIAALFGGEILYRKTVLKV